MCVRVRAFANPNILIDFSECSYDCVCVATAFCSEDNIV